MNGSDELFHKLYSTICLAIFDCNEILKQGMTKHYWEVIKSTKESLVEMQSAIEKFLKNGENQ